MATVVLTDEERIYVKSLFDSLKSTEREVVELVVDGDMNRTMARKLHVAVRTIETRRAKAMAKLRVQSHSDLVKLWLAYAGEFKLIGNEQQ